MLPRFPSQFSGTYPVFLLERSVEVRPVFKTAHRTYLVNTHVGRLQQIVAVVQAFFKKPFAGRRVEDLFKFLFECRQASAAQSCEIFKREVAEKIGFHDLTNRSFIGQAQRSKEIAEGAIRVA